MAPAQHNLNHQPARSQAGFIVSGNLSVLIDFPLPLEYVHKIGAVDPHILPVTTFIPSDGNSPSPDSGEEGGWKKMEDDELDAALSTADILFTFWPPAGWLEKAPRLKWIQLASAGADHVLQEGMLQEHPHLLVTTASGIHAVPISEHILGMILHFSRGFDKAVRNQHQRKWERFTLDEANGKTVCLIGYGAIARRTAMLCKTLGMRVVVVRASLTEQHTGLDAVERFYPLSDLNEALALSDYVVIAAPRTPRSEGMIGREQLAAMKQRAILINISRGALVDEPALIEALREGKLAGAGLDVFTQEPLPEESPLWSMPNVLITPHTSGSNPHYQARATELFCENLARYLRGEQLRNLVDAERGY